MGNWWDDFSNNLATDLAPLIALFGESPTKQYLSECLTLTDILIFSTAPIGIITTVVSAIRVRGSPSMRAFIGRAQEGGGNAEAELCSSTSRDVCELYNNGGIARVFGRPKLLEVVLDSHPEAEDFYKSHSNDETPASAGIYPFREYMLLLRRRENLPIEQDERDGRGGIARSTNTVCTSRSDDTGQSKDRKSGRRYRDWEECTERRTVRLRRILPHVKDGARESGNDPELAESAPEDDAGLASESFAPNPNLSLNIGIKKHSQALFVSAAVAGVLLQSAVLAWAAVARYKLRFVRNDPTDRYSIPITIMGTLFLALGVGFCAFLVESSTEERVFKRKRTQSYMYWVQPGNQYVGDQVFDSFAYSDRREPLTTYTISKKKHESRMKQRSDSSTVVSDHTRQAWLVWTAIILTTLGFVMQFLGLRACHSSVAVAQLGVMLVMSMIRALLRTRRIKKGDNRMSDRPDAYVGHELDWLALDMDTRDKSFQPKQEETRGMLYWKIPSSAAVVPAQRPMGNTLPRVLQNTDDIQEFQSPTMNEECTVSDLQNDMEGFDSHESALNWLRGKYSPDSARSGEELPHELARRFLYRCRLARITNDWNDDFVATRNIARNLAQAITETANILTLGSAMKKDWRKNKILYWPVHGHLSRTSGGFRQNSDRKPVFLALKRAHSDIQSSAWTIDESELEAMLGLWAWSLREEIAGTNLDRQEIVRILSTNSTHKHNLNLWREPGMISIIPTTFPKASRLPLLLCGLYTRRRSNYTGAEKVKSTNREDYAEIAYSLKVKGTIPEVCAQELYSLFFLSILKGAVGDIGGKTTIREGFEEILMTNTTILNIQSAFIKSGLGSIDDAFACTIPALISSHRLPSVSSTLADARETAEQNIRNREWTKAERLLRWALEQCHEDERPVDLDLAFDFENRQRLLLLALCELYRKWQESIKFRVQKFENLKNVVTTPGQRRIELLTRERVPRLSKSSLELASALFKPLMLRNHFVKGSSAFFSRTGERAPQPFESLLESASVLNEALTLETVIEIYKSAAQRSHEQSSSIALTETKIIESLKNRDHVETLYLISKLEIENRKMSLGKSLLLASQYGWLTFVQALIELGADTSYEDDEERRAIIYAARGGELNILEYLIEKVEVYPDHMDRERRSPLSYASEQGHTRVVKRLLGDKRVLIDSVDLKNRTPLLIAVEEGQEAIVRLLLEHGAQTDSGYRDDMTPLFAAVSEGHEAIVKLLLERGAQVNSGDSGSVTPLQKASEKGYKGIVKQLLNKNANVDTRSRNSKTALQLASENGYEEIVKQLLDENADVNITEGNSETALQSASRLGYDQIVKYLLDKDADTDVSKCSETALQLASKRGHEQIVEHLLDKNADVNLTCGNSPTALQLASKGGHEQIVKLLLNKNADVNATSIIPETALQLALKYGHEEIAKLLPRDSDAT